MVGLRQATFNQARRSQVTLAFTLAPKRAPMKPCSFASAIKPLQHSVEDIVAHRVVECVPEEPRDDWRADAEC